MTAPRYSIRTKELVRLLEAAAGDYGSKDVDRAVLANALGAGGMSDLAASLRHFPPHALFGGSRLEGQIRRVIFEPRPHTPRRGGKPSTYHVRTEDLSRLFYDANKEEMNLAPTRAGDIATREVLADALEERGLSKLATELRRFNLPRRKAAPPRSEPARGRTLQQILSDQAEAERGTFGGSFLREKIRRAIFGPQKRSFYDRGPQKRRDILLADLGSGRRGGGGIREIDKWHVDSEYETYYVFEVSDGGYGSITFLVGAYDESSALEIAEEQWPDWFFDEVDHPNPDEDDEDEDIYAEGNFEGQPHPTKEGVWVRPTENSMAVYRARWVARGRVIEPASVGSRGTAYVPSRGVVEYTG